MDFPAGIASDPPLDAAPVTVHPERSIASSVRFVSSSHSSTVDSDDPAQPISETMIVGVESVAARDASGIAMSVAAVPAARNNRPMCAFIEVFSVRLSESPPAGE